MKREIQRGWKKDKWGNYRPNFTQLPFDNVPVAVIKPNKTPILNKQKILVRKILK